jgi:putative PIN family toxin of toxin-antitoxin system
MSIVVDTNIVVSALLFGGPPGDLAKLWQVGKLDPIFSKDILDEYLKVLAYPKFSLSEKEIEFLLKQEILPYFRVVETSETQSKIIITADPDDDKFIICALADKCDLIISGDKHLLDLGSYHNIEIITPAAFLTRNQPV